MFFFLHNIFLVESKILELMLYMLQSHIIFPLCCLSLKISLDCPIKRIKINLKIKKEIIINNNA